MQSNAFQYKVYKWYRCLMRTVGSSYIDGTASSEGFVEKFIYLFI